MSHFQLQRVLTTLFVVLACFNVLTLYRSLTTQQTLNRNVQLAQAQHENMVTETEALVAVRQDTARINNEHQHHLRLVIDYDLQRMKDEKQLLESLRKRLRDLGFGPDLDTRRALPDDATLRRWGVEPDAGEVLARLPNGVQTPILAGATWVDVPPLFMPVWLRDLRGLVFDSTDGGTFHVPWYMVPTVTEFVKQKQARTNRQFLNIAPREVNALTNTVDP